jgi:hypothetical protein
MGPALEVINVGDVMIAGVPAGGQELIGLASVHRPDIAVSS